MTPAESAQWPATKNARSRERKRGTILKLKIAALSGPSRCTSRSPSSPASLVAALLGPWRKYLHSKATSRRSAFQLPSIAHAESGSIAKSPQLNQNRPCLFGS